MAYLIYDSPGGTVVVVAPIVVVDGIPVDSVNAHISSAKEISTAIHGKMDLN